MPQETPTLQGAIADLLAQQAADAKERQDNDPLTVAMREQAARRRAAQQQGGDRDAA